ncbi:SDR family oxidoreductase [uncultured Sphingomonas sp.]|uniref:SDR family oxidoreductase n=1 Tax=uncultured Sphingomonas sp. TaxID=158754 RepID=UPI0035CAF9EA
MGSSVLITGTSSGFGRMAALELARAGHRVHATMRESEARNRPQADEYRRVAAGEKLSLRPLEMDIGDQASVDAAVGLVLSDGPLDVVVHNAGHMNLGPTEAFSVEQLASLYDSNVLGTQRVNRAVLPHMRERGDGLLLWVSSTTVRANWPPLLGPYFAVKAAMEQLAISYALELARFGIETSIVVPGAFTSGTNHFQHAMQPSDAAVASVYRDGPTGDLEAKVMAAVEAFEPDDADPTEVGRAIRRVVDAPRGRRPFRVTVDPSEDGSEAIAAVQDRLRRDTLKLAGLGDIAR